MNLKQKTGLRYALFIALFGIVLAGLWAVFDLRTAGGEEKLDDRIRAAKSGLVNGRDEKTGIFVYEADLLRGGVFSSANMVRNALGVLALGEYLYLFDKTDEPTIKAMNELLVVYKDLSKPIGPGSSVVTSIGYPVEAAETGATANALIGALYYKYATGDNGFDDLIESWKNGLLLLYRNGAGFKETPVKDKEDPYFNGEAWSALSLYYGFTKDQNILNVLEKLAVYMTERYKYLDTRFFHWGLRAAAYNMQNGVAANILPGYIESQIEQFLISDFVNMRPYINCGAMEGFGNALKWLKPGELRQKAWGYFIDSMNFNVIAQVLGGFKRLDGTFVPVAKSMARFNGSFLWSVDSVMTRVDATTHCLSSLLLQKQLQEVEKP